MWVCGKMFGRLRLLTDDIDDYAGVIAHLAERKRRVEGPKYVRRDEIEY